jgi:hypothetical protein
MPDRPGRSDHARVARESRVTPSPRAMLLKPRRKWSSIGRLMSSARGRRALKQLTRFVGIEGEPEALGMTRSGGHVFAIPVASGQALVVEPREIAGPEPGVWLHTWFVFAERDDQPMSMLVEFKSQSWDPHTAAHLTGDRTLVDGPKRLMYAERDRRDAELDESATANVRFRSQLPDELEFAGMQAGDLRRLQPQPRPGAAP